MKLYVTLYQDKLQRVGAIKRLRQVFDLGLKEAKDLSDSFLEEGHIRVKVTDAHYGRLHAYYAADESSSPVYATNAEIVPDTPTVRDLT